MTNVIEVANLTKSYGKRRGIVDVGFEVREGEVFGFLGPNGAGKTTTIRTLLGMLRPTAGRATIFGLDVWHEAPAIHRRLTYVGSDPGYLGELTSGEQLDVLAALRGLPRGALRAAAERGELDPTVQVRNQSGDAPVLMLDEPSTGLDPLMQRVFLALVADARAAGRTIFLSSHNLAEVERSCDRVGIIREGRLIEVTEVQALLAGHWRTVTALLEAPAPAGTFDLPNVEVVTASARDVHLMVKGDVNPVLRRLAGLDVVDVSIQTPDVEDIFLRYYDDGATESRALAEGGAR